VPGSTSSSFHLEGGPRDPHDEMKRRVLLVVRLEVVDGVRFGMVKALAVFASSEMAPIVREVNFILVNQKCKFV